MRTLLFLAALAVTAETSHAETPGAPAADVAAKDYLALVPAAPHTTGKLDWLHSDLDAPEFEPVIAGIFRKPLGVEIHATPWFATLRGSFNDGGGSISVQNDLGIGDENVFMGKVTVRLTRLRFVLEGFDAEFRGDRALSNDVTFGDTTFTAGTRTQSSFDLKNLGFRAEFGVFNNELFSLFLGLGLAHYDIAIQLSSTDGTESSDGTAYIPMIEILGQVRLGDFTIELGIAGSSVGISDWSGDYLDTHISAGYHVIAGFGAEIGYRRTLLDGDLNGVKLDNIAIDGFFVGLTWKF